MNINHNILKTHPKIVLVICMLIFLVFNIQSIQKPFLLDDASFVGAADAINHKGVPIFYEGEEAKEKVGLWHPPLYIYLLAMSFKLFKVSEASAHLIGTVFSLGTMVLIYLLSLEVFKENENKQFIALASSFIYAINPFVIQSAILIDIDTSILTFLMTLFILIFVKSTKMKTAKRLLILGFLFAVLIWAKFGTPLFMIVSIFIFHVINKEYKKGVFYSAMIVLIGYFFFLFTWLLYCNITHLSFLLPFQHNMATGSFDERGIRLLLKMLWGIKNLSFWTTPFFIILVFGIFLEHTQNFLKIRKLKYVDLLIICGMVIFFAYSIIRTNAYGFPKYYAPAMPFFSIMIGGLIVQSGIINSFKKNNINYIICFAITILYLSYVVQDPLIFPYKQEYSILIYQNLFKSFVVLSIYKVLTYLLPLLIVFIILKILKTNVKTTKLLIFTLIFALITTSIYVDIIQSQAEYSTTYNYGETGLRETASYIQRHTNINDTIIGETDIGYYSKRPYYRAFLLGSSSDKLQELINSNNITYMVFRSNDLWNKEFRQVINSKYILVDRIGSFVIYKKKDKNIR